MRSFNSCRAFMAASALALGGCGDGETLSGPSSVNMGQAGPLLIEGFPATQRLRMGENVLLLLKEVPPEVESIRWISNQPRVASVMSTPSVSPCGSACAWLRGEAAGSARIEALLCFVDGSCQSVTRARVCVAGGMHEVETALSVTP